MLAHRTDTVRVELSPIDLPAPAGRLALASCAQCGASAGSITEMLWERLSDV